LTLLSDFIEERAKTDSLAATIPLHSRAQNYLENLAPKTLSDAFSKPPHSFRRRYTPRLADVGCHLILAWTPVRSDGKKGLPLKAFTDSPVEAGELTCLEFLGIGLQKGAKGKTFISSAWQEVSLLKMPSIILLFWAYFPSSRVAL
jgi:hypothetical protein